MQKKLQAKLYRKYPELFQDRKEPGSITRMCDGIACNDGWYNLIADVCAELDLIRIRLGVLVTFFQIKEKLAGLRIYLNRPQPNCNDMDTPSHWTPKQSRVMEKIIHDVAHYAMCQSYATCEECGGYRYGTKKLGSWLYAMCDKCWAKFLKEKNIKSKKKRINKRYKRYHPATY